MKYHLTTKLNGDIAITSHFQEDNDLLSDASLYKFIWVQKGYIDIEVDHVLLHIEKDEIISLTPLNHIKIEKIEGEYLTFLFNSNFYCIYGHDDEVSCNGLLFNGSSIVMRLNLSNEQSSRLQEIISEFNEECNITDHLQEEMLRILLKRFIIMCSRIARKKYGVDNERENNFDTVRHFYILVDNNFKEKKQVRDYADMLCRSPKTLSNMFALYGLPTPLHVIHDRINAEAKRLLLYTSKSAKEISIILGFEDLPTFSRFFRRMNKTSLTEYRKSEEKE